MSSMKINLYRDQSGNSSARLQPGDSLDINDQVETHFGKIYRRLVYLRIPRDGVANGIELDAPLLTCQFQPDQLTIGKNSSKLEQNWQFMDDKIVVHLRQPWHLHSVKTVSYAKIYLFRMDGEAIADESSATAIDGEVIGTEFISQHFAIKVEPMKRNKLAPSEEYSMGKLNSSTERVLAYFPNKNYGNSVYENGHEQVMQANAAFHRVNSITLNSYPTTPRVSIPADLSTTESELITDNTDIALDVLWQQAGEYRETTLADLSAKLETQLPPKLAAAIEQNAGSDDDLWIPLVIDSDLPCVWKLNEINLPYLYYIDRFNDGSDRFTFEFNDHHAAPQLLPITLPPGGVTHASFRIDIGNKSNLKPNNDLSTSPNEQTGLLLNQECWYASRISPSQAGFYGAVSVLISIIGPEVELKADLIEGDLSSSGEPLASASFCGHWREERQWLTLKFDPVRLDATYYWLRLKASEGKCIWLCQNNGNAVTMKGVLQNPNEEIKLSAALMPVSHLSMQDLSPQKNSPLFTMLADGAAVRLNDGDDYKYEINVPSEISGATHLQVQQTAMGTLIFSSPKIEYSPAD